MKRFLTLLCICVLLTTTTVDAKSSMKINASMVHRTPTYKTKVQRVFEGDSKVSLSYDNSTTEGWGTFPST